MIAKVDALFAERARQRRATAVKCALAALDELAKAGVQAGIVGSLARGAFQAHSDVDFLILEHPGAPVNEVIAIIERAMDGLPFDVIFQETVSAADAHEFL